MTDKLLSEETMTLEPILSQEFYSTDIETTEVFISEIKDKNKITEIVDFLNKTIPLKELNHLKRIKSKNNVFEVIICLKDNQNKHLAEDVNRFLTETDLLPLKCREVAKSLPKTSKQFEFGSKLWPINFHPNKYLEKCLSSTLFDSKARKTICDLINKTIELSDNCGQKSSMAAIVTDSNNKIITSCKSEVKTHPLRHAVLVAIDSVSQIQRSDDNRQEIRNSVTNDSYLCTGYDFYLSSEPCLMCAMALVHSRIRRLFFLDSESTVGDNECTDRAIVLHKFHLLPKLNHHFESWKVMF